MNTKKHIEKAIEAIEEEFGTCKILVPGCAGCEATIAIYHLQQLLKTMSDE